VARQRRTYIEPERQDVLLGPIVQVPLKPAALFVSVPDDTGSRFRELADLGGQGRL
jgi:hypothetical protein